MKKILLGHGSGGRLTHDLIKNLFLKNLRNAYLSNLDDSAILRIGNQEVVFTTDSYVVNPLFFPGGDIGKLSICGTVNDLSVCGAEPLYIAVSVIMEEGLDMALLGRVVSSIKKAAHNAGVKIVTGDTKVVEKGMCDKLFITTSGIGVKSRKTNLSLDRVKKGDRIIVSGAIGEHGVCILSSREGLNITSRVRSDCASVNSLVAGILKAGGIVKFMRDPTRGGLATTLNEFVDGRRFGIVLDEERIPVSSGVKGICELLGFDPLYMANEGRVVMIVSKKGADKVLKMMRRHPQARGAHIIGECVGDYKGKVCLNTSAGGLRLVKMLEGEQLPRIC
ncbi:MAG: hydrogenase expression/formation protein HypE [Candidatus Omnitrophica bacterium]|nr:hydrogenase expression/formation protein HypE [Candidatus Omnitrophota bacterium]